MNNFLRILVRALENRPAHDPEERRAVYEMSRRTLAAFFRQTPDLDPVEREQQLNELESAIAEIESRFAAPSPAASPEASEPKPERPSPPRPRVDAPPVAETAAPPPPPARPTPPPPKSPPPKSPPPKSAPPAPPAPRPSSPARPTPPAPPPPRPQPPAARPPQPSVSAPVRPQGAPQPSRGAKDDAGTVAGSAAEEKPPTVASAPPRTTSPRTSGEDEGSTAGVPEASGTARNLEELFTDADEVAPVEDPELVADSEERELRRRNRRGTLLLFVTLLVVATAYGSGITDRLLLYVAGSAKTSVVPPPLAVDGAKGLRTDDTKVILDALREAPRDGDPIVVRVDTTPAAPRRDRSAVIHWTRGGSGEASLQGRAEFADLPLRFEILVETDPDATSGFTRMALITFEASPEPILEAPMFERIDPTTGARRAVEGTSVRVGIDRILYGFRADPTDGAADATRRSLFDFSFTLDSGRRMRIVLRPPSSD